MTSILPDITPDNRALFDELGEIVKQLWYLELAQKRGYGSPEGDQEMERLRSRREVIHKQLMPELP